MGRYRKLAIIIPAHNEEKSLAEVCVNASKLGDVIVIDDNSTDETEKVARSLAKHTFSSKEQLGYSGAVLSGLKLAENLGYDHAVTIDGDGQHNPKDIEQACIGLETSAYISVGCRNQKGRLAENFIAVLYTRFFGIKDPFSGLKGFNISKLKPILKSEKEFHMGLTVLNYCLIHKHKIYQFDIEISQRRTGGSRVGGIILGNLRVLNCSKSIKMFFFRKGMV